MFLLAQRFGKPDLLTNARAVDSGLDDRVLADMMGSLGRFPDDEIPIAAGQVCDLRDFFGQWQQELNGAAPAENER